MGAGGIPSRRFRGDMAQPAELTIEESPAELEELYRQMLFIRHFEEKCNQVYRMGKAGGYLHVYIGMEATAVGWLSMLRKDDYVITAYRDHAQALLMGNDPVAVMAEIMGRRGGTSKGKGGSMHLYDIPHNFFGGWGIVGGHIPLGAGLAFASKYKGEDRVTLNFLGDGASNAGVFYETLNMAGLWDLPCIFLIENNEFAMGTRLEYHAANVELHRKGYPFGIRHERMDGMDVLAVRKAARRIIDYVRNEQRPYLVEVMNYRFAGHGAADNDQSLYRTPDEVEAAKARDPIKLLENVILAQRVLTPEQIEAIHSEIEDQVQEIYEKADAMPFPDPEEVYDNVYTDMEVEKGH
ncbi:MAG TPA: pyruvate dehydrogenase (acetyl-transferring) E1 component subunit alpha [Armatimonadetes bacterium]|nr:pyruvate dehydrogenase (acetyl-transferring) E1 component subunit alpha [Armatimonadota bacterium]